MLLVPVRPSLVELDDLSNLFSKVHATSGILLFSVVCRPPEAFRRALRRTLSVPCGGHSLARGREADQSVSRFPCRLTPTVQQQADSKRVGLI